MNLKDLEEKCLTSSSKLSNLLCKGEGNILTNSSSLLGATVKNASIGLMMVAASYAGASTNNAAENNLDHFETDLLAAESFADIKTGFYVNPTNNDGLVLVINEGNGGHLMPSLLKQNVEKSEAYFKGGPFASMGKSINFVHIPKSTDWANPSNGDNFPDNWSKEQALDFSLYHELIHTGVAEGEIPEHNLSELEGIMSEQETIADIGGLLLYKSQTNISDSDFITMITELAESRTSKSADTIHNSSLHLLAFAKAYQDNPETFNSIPKNDIYITAVSVYDATSDADYSKLGTKAAQSATRALIAERDSYLNETSSPNSDSYPLPAELISIAQESNSMDKESQLREIDIKINAISDNASKMVIGESTRNPEITAEIVKMVQRDGLNSIPRIDMSYLTNSGMKIKNDARNILKP